MFWSFFGEIDEAEVGNFMKVGWCMNDGWTQDSWNMDEFWEVK
jgi:hypothetical protein